MNSNLLLEQNVTKGTGDGHTERKRIVCLTQWGSLSPGDAAGTFSRPKGLLAFYTFVIGRLVAACMFVQGGEKMSVCDQNMCSVFKTL